jgi:hypothetical protein
MTSFGLALYFQFKVHQNAEEKTKYGNLFPGSIVAILISINLRRAV